MSDSKPPPPTPPKPIPSAQAAYREMVQRLRANPMQLVELEKAGIEATLMTTHSMTKAARVLGIGRTTLYRKLKVYGIQYVHARER